jgi:hypothetical protein
LESICSSHIIVPWDKSGFGKMFATLVQEDSQLQNAGVQ